MKEIIDVVDENRTPLLFSCNCGTKFVSNEYHSWGKIQRNTETIFAVDICPKCNKETNICKVYSPPFGSEEFKKWYLDKENIAKDEDQ